VLVASSKKALAVFLSQGVTSLEAVQAVSAAFEKEKQWSKTEKGVLKAMGAFFSKRCA
jgi:hypothetical protein